MDALRALLMASGDEVELRGETLQRLRWRLFPDVPSEVLSEIWLAPFRGMLAVYDRFLALESDGRTFRIVPGQG